MINIKTFIFNPFQVNTYLLYDETKECIIIDAGCYDNNEQEIILSFIEKNKLKPVKLLNTHCHIDHIFGNNYIGDKYKLFLEIHEADQFLIDAAIEHAKTFGLEINKQPAIGKYLNDNEIIKFGNSELKIIHIPGHSPGGIVFYNKQQEFIIAGDVLFCDSIGRTDLPGGNHEQLVSSIKNKLLILDDNVKVFSGHGETTTIGNERKNNPYL
ncbi:MAG: MBL fold metallo-hydrolase [Bacteroidales bacterium]|nr:MBL fold metallo-hydrolase [Bacteroidales bacterium]